MEITHFLVLCFFSLSTCEGNYQLDGCYGHNDLEYTQEKKDRDTMTVDICVDFCKGHNTPYAFLRRGYRCSCGNVKDSPCSEVCSGATQDDKRPCGENSRYAGYLLIYQSASTSTATVKNVGASSQTVTKDGLTATVTTLSAKLPNTVLIALTTAEAIVIIILIVLLLRKRKANGKKEDKRIKETQNKQSDNSGATELYQSLDVTDKTRARMQTSGGTETNNHSRQRTQDNSVNTRYDDASSSTSKNVYEVLRVTSIKPDPTYDSLVKQGGTY